MVTLGLVKFHWFRSNNNCSEIDKCIHDIQDNFLIIIEGDGNVRVSEI